MIQNLTYEFSILAKAIQHKNLTAAAQHVGLSQPQLSRLVTRIENELNVVLLDRAARRKSGWTQVAMDLSHAFTKGIGRLESEILGIATEREVTEIHVATLEGLSELALPLVHRAFKELGMKKIFLDVLDFQDLEAQFLNGSLDLIFTVKFPSPQKFKNFIELGYQQMESHSAENDFWVGSLYDIHSEKKVAEKFRHLFVSNSLSLRKQWLVQHQGTGQIPSAVTQIRGRGSFPVYLIGAETLTTKLWKSLTGILG